MTVSEEDLLRELLETFQVEAAEYLETINQALLRLERKPEEEERQQVLQEAFRAAHSMKGAARAVELKDIANLSHAMENILQQARDEGLALDTETCDLLYKTLDTVGQFLGGEEVEIEPLLVLLLERVGGKVVPVEEEAEPQETNEVLVSFRPGEETVRVSVGKLDDLMAQVGELLVSKISAEQRQVDAQSVRYQLSQLSKTWQELRTQVQRLNGNAGNHIHGVLERQSENMQSLLQEFDVLDQSINRDTMQLGMVTSGLQEEVRRLRMVPFQTLVPGLERALRDAARTEDKEVAFQVEGGETELDKKILETLKDPLLHLLRNAVSHGIESPEKRTASEKPAQGQVRLFIRQRGSEVRIMVSDDGQGFDLEALRQSAVMRGGSAPDENASADELIGLAFQPGVTTSQQVTAMSGRGVGLDVVRQGLKTIQGRISIHNQPGQGTAIELIVPTSLAMTRGLLVRVGNEHYVLPLLSIEKIEEPRDSFVVGGKRMLNVAGTPLPLVSLAAALERPVSEEEQSPNLLAIIMGVAEQRLALLVDDVLTEQDLAIKALGQPLQQMRNVAGAALLGNGEPVIVLNPADLLKSALNTHVHDLPINRIETDRAEPSTHILVVDDSITTRTLEKNILEAAGFIVTTATDGLEALKYLKGNSIDLVVADIEMPNMNGFALTRNLKESTEYGHLPVILVTSLESREDREQGMLSGADAYILKRGFDQAELLATIQRFL